MSQEKMNRNEAAAVLAGWLVNGKMLEKRPLTADQRAMAAFTEWALSDGEYTITNLDEVQRARQLAGTGADAPTLVSELARELETRGGVAPMAAREKAQDLVAEGRVSFVDGAFRWNFLPGDGVTQKTVKLETGAQWWLGKPAGKGWLGGIRARVGDEGQRLVGFFLG